MPRIGRKRSNKPRSKKTGRIAYGFREESPDEAMATVKAQRLKIVASENWRDPAAESPLGRLLLAGRAENLKGMQYKHEAGIDRKQYDALCHWRQVVAAYKLHCLDSPPANPPSMPMERADKGAPRETDPETARKARDAYNALYGALCDAEKEIGMSSRTRMVINELVIHERWPFSMSQRRVAEMARVCGNHLDRVRTGLTDTK